MLAEIQIKYASFGSHDGLALVMVLYTDAYMRLSAFMS